MYKQGQIVTLKISQQSGIICDKLKTSDKTLYQIKIADNIIYAVEDELCQTTIIYD